VWGNLGRKGIALTTEVKKKNVRVDSAAGGGKGKRPKKPFPRPQLGGLELSGTQGDRGGLKRKGVKRGGGGGVTKGGEKIK